MLRKKIICSLIAGAMSLGILTGCNTSNDSGKTSSTKKEEIGNMNLTGYPIVKDKVTIKVAFVDEWSSPDPNTKKVIQDLEAKTNVHVEWSLIPLDSAKEKTNLMFASNQLPDAFIYGYYVDAKKGIEQGQLIDLKELIDKYAPNIKKAMEKTPSARELATWIDGKIYTVPAIDQGADSSFQDTFFMNKKWLEKVNKKVPTTVDEFYDVLKAFKTQDPNGNGRTDEIPMSAWWNNTINGLTNLFGSWGTVAYGPGNLFIIKDNKVVVPVMESGYKEAIKYFSKLYKEELLDKEIFTIDQKAFRAKTSQNPAIVGAWCGWGGWNEAGSLQRSKDEYAVVLPLKGPEGKQNWTKQISGIITSYNYITSAAKNPEVIIRWMDTIAEPEQSVIWLNGTNAVKKNASGKYEAIAPPDGTPIAVWRAKETIPQGPVGIYKEWSEQNQILSENVDYKNQINKLYEPFGTFSKLSMLKYTQKQSDQLSMLATNVTDIDNYVKQKEAEWIVKGNIDADWDGFIKKMKELKIDDIQKIHQEALDTYNKNKSK
jgi:putative aldouronate transport system substrate-binding protein